MKGKIAVLFFTLAVAAWCVAQTQANEQITNGPTIEGVSGNTATIAWSTNTGGSSVVRYGTDPNNLTQTAQSPWVPAGQTHRVQLQNLQPGSTYYYQVLSGQGQGTGTGALSNIGQFTVPGTAQAPTATQSTTTRAPVYRAFNTKTGAHLYTTNAQQLQTVASQGFTPEGTVFYVNSTPAPGDVPLYQLVNANGDYMYTANPTERANAASAGYRDAGILGYISSTPQPGTEPLYRYYNGAHHVHFMDTNASANGQLASQGWQQEGIIGYVWGQQ